MTTKVTIDAHAGWPVEVEVVTLDSQGADAEVRTEVVPKSSIKDFYIHSHLYLRSIKELKG